MMDVDVTASMGMPNPAVQDAKAPSWLSTGHLSCCGLGFRVSYW